MIEPSEPRDPEPTLLEEIKSYVGFSSEDALALEAFYPHAKPHFKAITDEFYAVIRLHEGAASVIRDEEQAQKLHTTLQLWMDELLTGPHDAAYFQRRVRIGQVHVRVGLPQHYMVTAMSRVRTSLQSLAAQVFAPDPGADARCRLAIARVCDMDLAIILDSYRNDMVARIRRMELLEREALEVRLREGERFFQDALVAADVAVMGFDASGSVSFFNRKAETLTGYAADELQGTQPFETFFGAEATAIRASLLGAKKDAPVQLETNLRTRAGRIRRVVWHSAAHQATGTDAPRFVVVGIDVTETRELERTARKAERLAAAGALAAGLAHEIRNPLNGASLHLAVLERALARAAGLSPAVGDAVVVVRGEIKRLSDLVSDFLEVARPRPLARAPCDLNDLTRTVLALVAPEAAARRIEVRVEPWPFEAVEEIDSERIKQVLLNLIRNGIESIGEGGAVTVRVRRTPHSVELDVEDDGPGVADASAPIFDAFFTTKERGTGLGLSIVHRIVTDHGGDIAFTSAPKHTVFTVRLPSKPRFGTVSAQ